VAYPAALSAAAHATEAAALPRGGADVAEPAAKGVAEAAQCQILRDLFGLLPFRPVTIAPDVLAWNDGTVSRIAEGIYEERAFDRLPILADALEEAGCDEPDILGHLRGPGPHVRGCWPVDLLLGKS
jgi:hypothetical protein